MRGPPHFDLDNCMNLEERISLQIKRLQSHIDYVDAIKEYHDRIERENEPPDMIARVKKHIRLIESGEEMSEYLLDLVPILRKYDGVEESPVASTSSGGPIMAFVDVKNKQMRGQLFKEYMCYVELKELPWSMDWWIYGSEMNNHENTVCTQCSVPLLYDKRESNVVCPQCGKSAWMCCDSNDANLSYEDEINRDHTSYYAYKRINHFSEWLASVQAKENTTIPDEVLDSLRAEYKKIRVFRAFQITPSKTKEFLKKLKLTKYYEHVHYITNLLNGLPTPKVPAALEAKLKSMFQEIQTPWKRTKPKNRSNFFSYSYVLHKFCELLGADEYLPLFPMLKSSEKLFQQDQMWKSVCRELQWEFRPSL
jgi:predicted RNA-binding Zn-ribbon protein involved in translation (DUF1610 family)